MFPNIPISIVEVFPDDRDAEGPVRFKLVPKGNIPGA
jgi:hypothetical protein